MFAGGRILSPPGGCARRRSGGTRLLLACGFLALLISGCALNRVALKDALTAKEHNDLGVAYEARGEDQLARREYEAALRKEPALLVARRNLGNVLLKLGELKAAEAAFEEVLARDPKDAGALNNLAWVLIAQKKRLPTALKLAQRALRLDPEPARSAYYRDTIGMAYLSLGEASEAASSFQAAIGAAGAASPPELGELYFHLGLAYERSGDRTRAVEAWKKALSLLPEGDLARRVRAKLRAGR